MASVTHTETVPSTSTTLSMSGMEASTECKQQRWCGFHMKLHNVCKKYSSVFVVDPYLNWYYFACLQTLCNALYHSPLKWKHLPSISVILASCICELSVSSGTLQVKLPFGMRALFLRLSRSCWVNPLLEKSAPEFLMLGTTLPSGKYHSAGTLVPPLSLPLQHWVWTCLVSHTRELAAPSSVPAVNAPISVMSTDSPGRYTLPLSVKNNSASGTTRIDVIWYFGIHYRGRDSTWKVGGQKTIKVKTEADISG